MDIGKILFSWNGRSSRKPYWIGIVVVEITLFGLSIMLAFVDPAMTIVGGLITAYPRICVLTKRLHDLGRSGWFQVIPNMATGMLSIGGRYLTVTPDGVWVAAALNLIGLIISFGFLIWLGCVKGQDRANDFGPAPGAVDVAQVFT